MTNLIQVKGLSKTYVNEGVETCAVRKVDFEIKKGEFVAIMGPSGSGKSTLMQVLGFLDRPTEGSYVFESKDTKKFDDDQLADIRNRKIGFVFQSFNLLARTSVYENVELPLLYDHRRSRINEGKIIRNALKSVMLDHRINYSSNQLSGGEKQRVAIARALVNNPDIIFADEPTGNLDSKSGLQIMKILEKLNDAGKTVILVTHETYTAQHAKRIIQMIDGEIVSDETVDRRRVVKDGELLK
ncbi:MAG: ABC transporter ATP-binding protein [Patescibacteria group bacterium]|nr:ABC transporter ATP-binding protein [Patescibacteria group bacterium]